MLSLDGALTFRFNKKNSLTRVSCGRYRTRMLSLDGALTFRLTKKTLVREFLVGDIGLEPTTFAMSTQRSNQLS